MTKFIIRRLIQAIPTFFGITLLSYSIMVLAPGNPAMLTQLPPGSTVDDRLLLEERLGVNDPLPIQYLRWLVGDDTRVVERLKWYQFSMEDGTLIWLSGRQAEIDSETGEITLTASRQPYRLEPRLDAEIVRSGVGRRATLELVDETEEKLYGENKGILRGDFGRSFTWDRDPIDVIMV